MTPEEALPKKKPRRSRTPKAVKGQKFVLTTGSKLGHFEIQPLPTVNNQVEGTTVLPEKIFEIVLLTQMALPNQFITSNKAEIFNALHDRFNEYLGNKSFDHANRDVLAWIVMYFYPVEAKKLIARHTWTIPQYLLSKLFPFLISKVSWL